MLPGGAYIVAVIRVRYNLGAWAATSATDTQLGHGPDVAHARGARRRRMHGELCAAAGQCSAGRRCRARRERHADRCDADGGPAWPSVAAALAHASHS